MKKILFAAICLLGFASTAMAETYTLSMKDAEPIDGYASAWQCGEFTIIANIGNGSDTPTINVNKGDMRIYAGGSVCFPVREGYIESISFSISAQGLQRFAEITPDCGEIVEQGANPLVWKGSCNGPTFTVGSKAVYGTQKSKAGQFCFDEVTIVTSPGTIPGGDIEEPVVPEPDPVTGNAAVFDWSNPDTLSPSMPAPTSGNGVSVAGKTFDNAGVAVYIDKGESTTDPRLWLDANTNMTQLRVYNGSSMKFTSSSDIKTIKFLGTQASKGNIDEVETGTLADVEGQAVWTANTGAKEVKFAFNAQMRLSCIEVELEGAAVILGDANGDGAVSVADVVYICNAVLEIPVEDLVFAAADVDGDGVISVADVVLTVNIALSME